MGIVIWTAFGVALVAFLIALWANDRRKIWAGAAAVVAVSAMALVDPVQAAINAFVWRAERRRRAELG